MKIKDIAKKARIAATEARSANEDERVAALRAIAQNLRQKKEQLIAVNRKDLEAAEAAELSKAMIDRLEINHARLEAMATSCEQIAEQPAVLGTIVESHTRADGLKVAQELIPIGVIGIIFESRPNVVLDCSALAIKSGNAVILKGGKEAKHSNQFLGELVREAIAHHLPSDLVQVLDSTDRAALTELLQLRGEVDLIIPRGGEGLIQFVYDQSKIPVIAHFKGLCHIYVHEDAKQDQATAICLNAKVRRPGVCNAMETLLVHQKLCKPFLKDLISALLAEGVLIKGDEACQALHPEVQAASLDDWDMEYLDKTLSIKVVTDVAEAIEHIQKHGTNHTEAILAADQTVIARFKEQVDASCIVVNASTRFNDGGQLGLGAELGISTTKLHAYGPMGAREMTARRFVVIGEGHIRN